MGEAPPVGAVQLTDADASPAVAMTLVGAPTPAAAELGSTMSDDSSTASNGLAGTVFSSETICGYGPAFHPASSVPVRNQLDPWSPTMSPTPVFSSTTPAAA